MPVMYAAAGNCHVLRGRDRRPGRRRGDRAQREGAAALGVCNAAETLLVHADAAAEFLPRALRELRESGVELRVDGRTRTLAGELGDSLGDATEEDWATEYHALILAVKVVDSAEEAIEHVNRYGDRPLGGDRDRVGGRRPARSRRGSTRPAST